MSAFGQRWRYLGLIGAACSMWLLLIGGSGIVAALGIVGLVGSLLSVPIVRRLDSFAGAYAGAPSMGWGVVPGAGWRRPTAEGRRFASIPSWIGPVAASGAAAIVAVLLVALHWSLTVTHLTESWAMLAIAPSAVAAYLTRGLVEGSNDRRSMHEPDPGVPADRPQTPWFDTALTVLAQIAVAALVASIVESHPWLLVLLPLPVVALVRSLRRRERQRLDAEAELARRASHDAMTGLPNRECFLNRLNAAVNALRHDGSAVAVLFVDLDGFKCVNDRLGHHAGDRFLVAAAECLRELAPAKAVLARYGGDEFTVLLEDLGGPDDARRAADVLARAMCGPFALDPSGFRTTASVGVAISHHSAVAADDLLRDADTALYRAKALGGSRYVVHDPESTDAGKVAMVDPVVREVVPADSYPARPASRLTA